MVNINTRNSWMYKYPAMRGDATPSSEIIDKNLIII